MTTPKPLGQIAWETHIKGSSFAECPWDQQRPQLQAEYQRMAAAVARAVRRREKEKK